MKRGRPKKGAVKEPTCRIPVVFNPNEYDSIKQATCKNENVSSAIRRLIFERIEGSKTIYPLLVSGENIASNSRQIVRKVGMTEAEYGVLYKNYLDFAGAARISLSSFIRYLIFEGGKKGNE